MRIFVVFSVLGEGRETGREGRRERRTKARATSGREAAGPVDAG